MMREANPFARTCPGWLRRCARSLEVCPRSRNLLRPTGCPMLWPRRTALHASTDDVDSGRDRRVGSPDVARRPDRLAGSPGAGGARVAGQSRFLVQLTKLRLATRVVAVWRVWHALGL